MQAIIPSQADPKENDQKSGLSRDINIPDVDIRGAYKRKPLRHHIECGVRVKIGKDEVQTLKSKLGLRKCQMYKPNSFDCCVVCDEQVIDGEFATETSLFIPNKNDPAYDNLGRFRIELPRIACHECASEYASIHDIKVPPVYKSENLPLHVVWAKYERGELQPPNNTKAKPQPQAKAQTQAPVSSFMPTTCIPAGAAPAPAAPEEPAEIPKTLIPDIAGGKQSPPQQQQRHYHGHAEKSTLPLTEAERDPFDDGFLICTQLVKTGGADQGGLQVGDVFVEFGHYSKKRFPGLKSIANLVRRSAGKEITAIVWRKSEMQVNTLDDDGTGRTVFQKLALKLKPLQSHDADGGGVLGAVINTYPLPEMRN